MEAHAFKPITRRLSSDRPNQTEFYLDAFLDAFTPPGMLEPKLPPSGTAGFARDAENIRKYFTVAIGAIGIATETP